MHRRVRHLNPANCGAVVVLDGRFGVSGSPVSTWTGRTGTSVNATQSGTLRPTMGTLNGVPALVFDGVDDYMSVSDLTLYQNKAYGRMLAVAVDASTGAPTQHFLVTNRSFSRFTLQTRDTTSGVSVSARRTDADSRAFTTPSGTVTVPHIAEGEANWSGNSLRHAYNGVFSASVTFSSGGGSTSNTAVDVAQIGGNTSGSYAPVTIGAVVQWNATAAEALFRRVRHSLGFIFRIKTA